MICHHKALFSRSAGIGLALLATLTCVTPEDASAAEECRLIDKDTGETFRVFEQVRYRNTPDLLPHCIEPLKIWYSKTFWPDGAPSDDDFDLGLPDRDLVEAAAVSSPEHGPLTVIDIEHWPVHDAVFAQDAVDNYVTVTNWFKKAAPTQKVGFYSMVPIRDYWRAIRDKDHRKYKAWQEENDRLGPFANAVDILFPSLYTFYDEPEDWLLYAKAQIDESRRIAPEKPIFAYLWPVYHSSNNFIGDSDIEPDFWRMQLDFVRKHADGVVIWTRSDVRATDFGDIPPWWDETVRFLKESFECRGCPS